LDNIVPSYTTKKADDYHAYVLLVNELLFPASIKGFHSKAVISLAVFLSGQGGLSGGLQMRAGPGLQAFPAGLAAFLGGLQAFLGGLSLNRIFCLKDSLLPILRKSPKYET